MFIKDVIVEVYLTPQTQLDSNQIILKTQEVKQRLRGQKLQVCKQKSDHLWKVGGPEFYLGKT